jgi:hypothetical protein
MPTDILYQKYSIIALYGYNFNDELKNVIINNIDHVLILIKRFIKIIETCIKNKIDNYLDFLNIYADDKKIQQELLNYITNKQKSIISKCIIDNKQKSYKNANKIDIKDDLKKSIISECIIDNKQINKLKYNSVLEQIYKIINDGTKIIKNTKLNIKTINKNDEGFYYLENIGISVQRVESNKCLLEIINQCIENKIILIDGSEKIICLSNNRF